MQSTKDFKNKIKLKCGDDFELIGEYINSKTDVRIKHLSCGGEFNIKPYNFLTRKHCTICNKEKTIKNKSKTHEEFVKEIKLIFGDEYTILTNYKNANTKIKVKHNKCGREYYVRPSSILEGTGCKTCSIENVGLKQRKTHNEYIKEIFKIYGNEYSILSQYTTGNNKVQVRHNTCGHEYTQRAQAMLTGKGCPYCSPKKVGQKHRMTLNKYKQRVKEVTKGEYTVIGEYVNANTPILMHHNICNYEWETTPGHFLDGTRCPKCQKVATPTIDEIKEKIYSLVGNEYELLGEVERVNEKITLHHNKCNNNYKVRLSDFYRGNRCPYCSSSRGEKEIVEYLKSKNINFKREYRFKDCKYKYTLPFDFAIIKNESIKVLIEYDGIQHFKKTFPGESFERTKKTDKIKTNYCKKNNIPLLRIPYTEFDNVEVILENKLQQLKIL
mgnify:CR=1 FL=1